MANEHKQYILTFNTISQRLVLVMVLWVFYLNQIKSFVTENGGTVSGSYDCAMVRPKWEVLRETLKKGFSGLTTTITSFPCKQAAPCQ
jgi:hypothetical protein